MPLDPAQRHQIEQDAITAEWEAKRLAACDDAPERDVDGRPVVVEAEPVAPAAEDSAAPVVAMSPNPWRLSAFDSASDSADWVGISDILDGARVCAGWNDQISLARSPSGWSRSRIVAAALRIVASLLARLRTIRASARSRSRSASPNCATVSGSKPAKATRNASRLRRIVAQDSPDWKASSESRSKRPCTSRTGMPHSES